MTVLHFVGAVLVTAGIVLVVTKRPAAQPLAGWALVVIGFVLELVAILT
jgi:hypothetical protein